MFYYAQKLSAVPSQSAGENNELSHAQDPVTYAGAAAWEEGKPHEGTQGMEVDTIKEVHRRLTPTHPHILQAVQKCTVPKDDLKEQFGGRRCPFFAKN